MIFWYELGFICSLPMRFFLKSCIDFTLLVRITTFQCFCMLISRVCPRFHDHFKHLRRKDWMDQLWSMKKAQNGDQKETLSASSCAWTQPMSLTCATEVPNSQHRKKHDQPVLCYMHVFHAGSKTLTEALPI